MLLPRAKRSGRSNLASLLLRGAALVEWKAADGDHDDREAPAEGAFFWRSLRAVLGLVAIGAGLWCSLAVLGAAT